MECDLTFRPIAQATLAWTQTRPADYTPRTGLKPEREGFLLKFKT